MRSTFYCSAVLTLAALVAGQGAAAQAGQPRARFVSVYQSHNVIRDGQKGMLITIKCQVDGLRDRQVQVGAFFEWRNGGPLSALPGRYSTPNGQVTTQITVVPRFDYTDFNNIELFLPYRELNITALGHHDLRFHVEIHEKTVGRPIGLADSGDYHFYIDNAPPASPPPGAPATVSLVGTTWAESKSLANYSNLSFESAGNSVGSWS